jgi:hypothetical protein
MKNIIAVLLSLIVFAFACSKEEMKEVEKTSMSSESIFEDIIKVQNYTFYQGDSSVVPSSPQSAHSAYFRVRFNAIAAGALIDNGKLPTNGTFPEGSVIVKDLYNTQTGNLALYAVMKKASNDVNSKNGWLWAEYYPNGQVIYKIANKGGGCVSCHSTNQRDYIRLFDLF